MEFGSLRQHILQLAVSGQLVEQLDSEPAVEQVGPAPKPDEVPFELPPKWKWVQLNCLGVMQTGKTPPTKHSEYFGDDIPFITPGDIDELCHMSYTNRGVSLEAKKVIKTVPTGAVLMVCIGTVGKCGLAKQEVAFNQQINAITPNEVVVIPNFLLIALASPCCQVQVKLKAKATTIPIVNKTEWGSLWIPLPPIEEQRRIVAVVDELMGRLDQMETAYSEFAGPMTEHFRNLMLDKAIKGELVPQLDSEPEVEQVGPAPKPDEVPFELPPKWKWVQAKYLGSWKSGATPRRNNAEFWEGGTVPWLKTGEVSNCLVSATEEFVTEKAVKQAKLRLNPKGYVLVAMYGTGTVGNIGILGIPCTTNQACCACITNSDLIVNWYLFYVLLAFRNLLINKAAGTTNLQNLS